MLRGAQDFGTTIPGLLRGAQIFHQKMSLQQMGMSLPSVGFGVVAGALAFVVVVAVAVAAAVATVACPR